MSWLREIEEIVRSARSCSPVTLSDAPVRLTNGSSTNYTAPLNCGISKCRWNARSCSQHRDSCKRRLSLFIPQLPHNCCTNYRFRSSVSLSSCHTIYYIFFLLYFYKLHENKRDYLGKFGRRCRAYIHRDTCTCNCLAYSHKYRCRDYRPWIPCIRRYRCRIDCRHLAWIQLRIHIYSCPRNSCTHVDRALLFADTRRYPTSHSWLNIIQIIFILYNI